MKMAAYPRLVIGAPQGRSGKTTLAVGLCAALAARGLAVQPFKKGPDYIDPSWLTEAAGRACRPLDPFFLPEPGDLRQAFCRGAAGADVSIVEGNHGLYDSLAEDGSGSTAAVARTLQAPVLLVVNAARMARSAAAMVCGFRDFEPATPLAGVVLNNVSQARHEAKLRQAIERYSGLPVVGALPRDDRLAIPDRHLGLVPRAEDERLAPAVLACREAVERYVDLEALLAMARSAPPLPVPATPLRPVTGDRYASPDEAPAAPVSAAPPGPMTEQGLRGPEQATVSPAPAAAVSIAGPACHGDPGHSPPIARAARTAPGSGARHETAGSAASAVPIGVLRDRVFTFYYPENLEALEAAGAQLVFVDALRDAHLPAVAALYIGGGFPEVFMEELAANRSLLEDLRRAARAGLPIYAECGGLMYLARRIVWGSRSAGMAGVLPCDVEVLDRPQGHGYVLAEVAAANPFMPEGSVLRGHEYHHSRVVAADGLACAYRLSQGAGVARGQDALVCGNVLAAYTHLYAPASPAWAPGLVACARDFANAGIASGQ